MTLLAILRRPFRDLRERVVAWITRGETAEPRQVRLTRRRIYILPTRAGYGFAAILIVMLLGATNYSNSMAFVLTFLLVALGANAMWLTHRNLLGVDVMTDGAPPVFAGQVARVRIVVVNRHRQPRYGLRLHIADNPARTVDVPAQGQAEVELPLLAPGRGQLSLGRIRIETRYPLTLFEAWSWPSYTTSILVYPRPADDGPPLTLRGEGGEQGTLIRGDGDEFAGLRKHSPSDSPRHVAWKAVARTGRWLTKEFQSRRGEDQWLRWNDLAGYTMEHRLSILTRWVLDAHRQGSPYGLELPGHILAPDASDTHRHECLKTLALFRSTPPGTDA